MTLKLIIGTGGDVAVPQTFRTDVEYSSPFISFTANSKTPPLEDGMFLPVFSLSSSVSDYLVVNIDTDVTLSYYDYGTKQLCKILSIAGAGNSYLPPTVGLTQFTLSGSSLSVSDITTWKGTVDGTDIDKYLTKGIYWVESGELKDLIAIGNDSDYDAAVTRTIGMKGGKLTVNTDLQPGIIISSTIENATGGEIEIGESFSLNKSDLSADDTRQINLSGSGSYDLEGSLELGSGIRLADTWSGTVSTGDISPDTRQLDVSALGNDNSTVQLGKSNDISIDSLQAIDQTANSYVKNVITPGGLALKKGQSMVHNLQVNGELTLGSADSAASLIATGTLNTLGITLKNLSASASAGQLNIPLNQLNITILDSELQKLTGGRTTVLTLGKAFEGITTLNGTTDGYSIDGKTIYSLMWETPITRATMGTVLNLYANINTGYVQDRIGRIASSHNGHAGLSILSSAFIASNPQQTAPDDDLAELMNTVDRNAMTDDTLAAAAGSSVTVLGQALSGDTERQLKAIRNRAVSGIQGCDTITVTTIDSKGSEVSTTSTRPHKFSVWVNAEGNRAEQDADSTAAGYTLSSWGGTLGAGMQVNRQLTLGLALTAMSGNLKSDGPDRLKGDMETTYLSAFAQYRRGAWNHSLIGTAGTMDTDYDRTVSHATGSYTADGDTDGTSFGLMYEVSREFTLSSAGSISPVFNISYRHTDVDGYSERNSDAALSVDDQSLDTVTAGLGARYSATVGRLMLNRNCAFEARALAKYDFGDRQTDTTAGFIGQATRANIESAELGAFGVELGAGISVPVGSGRTFADGAVELRSEYTNVNATVGYRIQF